MPTNKILPFTPLGLSRTEAAAFIGVSASKFDELVNTGLMPEPKRIGTRKVWDREALTLHFRCLGDEEDCEGVESAIADDEALLDAAFDTVRSR